MRTHLVIPDTQVKPDVNLEHLHYAGKLIVDRQPDVIIHLGDHADMESLCTYDRGKKSFEGRRYKKDVEASIKGMQVLLQPMIDYNAQQASNKKKQYKPEMHFLLGNHEDRINRAISLDAILEGTISTDDLQLEEFGWKVHNFLAPVTIDGVVYSHYFPNEFSGRPLNSAKSTLNVRHQSCTQGHKQTLEVKIDNGFNGKRIRGLVAGAFYMHNEDYKGTQGNNHWRGLIYKHNVNEGDYDLEEISIERLNQLYGNTGNQ